MLAPSSSDVQPLVVELLHLVVVARVPHGIYLCNSNALVKVTRNNIFLPDHEQDLTGTVQLTGVLTDSPAVVAGDFPTDIRTVGTD